MHLLRLLTLATAISLAGCGGGGGDSPAPAAPPARLFGWWGIAVGQSNGLPDKAPGKLALVQGSTVEQCAQLVDEALSHGQQPVVMLWSLVWSGPGALLPDWRERLASLRAQVDSKVLGYYLDDEPGLNGHAPADLDAVAAALPADKLLMMSLSVGEIERGHIPAQVNLLGVNLYAAHGDTPASAAQSLGKLAARGKRMYLNLDGFAFKPPTGCASVTEAKQRASIELNEALLAWAKPRNDVAAIVPFLWSSRDAVCGARDLPILQNYLRDVAQKVTAGAL